MNQSNLKNMVVLKNLPSNLVEEAIVILKSNKKVKKLEKIENSKKNENTAVEKRENDYLLKEAEMLVSNYISELENKKEQRIINNKNINKKYKKLKLYAYIASIFVIIECLMILMK